MGGLTLSASAALANETAEGDFRRLASCAAKAATSTFTSTMEWHIWHETQVLQGPSSTAAAPASAVSLEESE